MRSTDKTLHESRANESFKKLETPTGYWDTIFNEANDVASWNQSTKNERIKYQEILKKMKAVGTTNDVTLWIRWTRSYDNHHPPKVMSTIDKTNNNYQLQRDENKPQRLCIKKSASHLHTFYKEVQFFVSLCTRFHLR